MVGASVFDVVEAAVEGVGDAFVLFVEESRDDGVVIVADTRPPNEATRND